MKSIYLHALLALLWAACQPPGPGQGEATNETDSETNSEMQTPAHYASRQQLVEVADLHSRQGQAGTVVIDMRRASDYAGGHIPGAHNVWRADVEALEGYAYGGMRCPRPQAEALLGRLGVEPADTLVIYDDEGNVNAARLWWLLQHCGHPRVALLHGGLQAWQSAGHALDTATVLPEPTAYRFPEAENPAHLAELNMVKAALDDPGTVILDVRCTKEFEGGWQKNGAARAGRIPGSVMIDYVDALANYQAWQENQALPLYFKGAAELQQLYARRGITPDKRVVVYCHSGVRSAHTTYVLSQLLGYKQVYNYDGSWTEWSHIKALPLETGPMAVNNAVAQ